MWVEPLKTTNVKREIILATKLNQITTTYIVVKSSDSEVIIVVSISALRVEKLCDLGQIT